MKHIIAIQGYRASGKDETAKFLHYLLNTPAWMHIYWLAKLLKFKPIFHKWKITRYAGGLKHLLAILLNVNIERFEDREFKEHYYFDFNKYKLLNDKKDKIKYTMSDKYFNRELKKNNLNIALNHTLSIRQILQFFGTEIMRKFLGDKLWIYNTLNTSDNFLIVADQRFLVEHQVVTSSNYKTCIIHVVRNSCQVGLHASERELEILLNEKKYDVLLDNNSTLKELFNKCKNITYNYLI